MSSTVEDARMREAEITHTTEKGEAISEKAERCGDN